MHALSGEEKIPTLRRNAPSLTDSSALKGEKYVKHQQFGKKADILLYCTVPYLTVPPTYRYLTQQIVCTASPLYGVRNGRSLLVDRSRYRYCLKMCKICRKR